MAIEGFGAKFEYTDAAGTFTSASGWTSVAAVTDFKPPEPEAGDIKTTNHDTPNSTHTYQGGLIEPGTSEITAHYDKTVYSTVYGLIGADKKFRIIFSDGSGIGWNGYFKKPATGIDLEGLNTMIFTTKVSGPVTPIAALT